MDNMKKKYPPMINPALMAQVAIQLVNVLTVRALIHPQLAQRWRQEANAEPEKVFNEIAAELKHLKNRKGQNYGT